MNNKSAPILFGFLATLILISVVIGIGCGGFGSNGGPGIKPMGGPVEAIQCSSPKGDIEDTIYLRLIELGFRSQFYQFNVSVDDTVSPKKVKVLGWSTGHGSIENAITDIAKGCDYDFSGFQYTAWKDMPDTQRVARAACSGQTYACGDVCIPQGQDCKLMSTSMPRPTP